MIVNPPDATASLHARIDDDGYWGTRSPGRRSGRNYVHASSDDVDAPARTCPGTRACSLDALPSRAGWVQQPDDEGGSSYMITNAC